MMKAVLSNADHPEYGVATIPLPVPRNQYDHCVALLEALEIGDASEADCRLDSLDSAWPVLNQLVCTKVNLDELDYLAKRLDSFDVGESSQFQVMAEKLNLTSMKALINRTFCCQQATVITDFTNLKEVGRDHYMNIHGGCASMEELEQLDGEETAILLIEDNEGTITRYGVVYDNGMQLSQLYDGRPFLMPRETDLLRVKLVAHTLLDVQIQETALSPVIVSHPFTNSGISALRNEDGSLSMVDLINNSDDCTRWRKMVGEQIDSAKNVHQIFVLFNPPYYLTFIKFAASALSEKDLGQLLSTAWTQEECPNQDCNVSKRELVALFRSVSPEFLMDEEERTAHQALEDTVTVYRGVTPYNAKNIRALSWTLDRKTADWFAHRFGEEGTVYEAQIRKEHILALFTGRNESEVIVDPRHLEQIMESPEPGFDMQMT